MMIGGPMTKRFKRVLFLGAALLSVVLLPGCSLLRVQPESAVVPLHYRSASELALAIRQGETTSLDLLDRYLSRIDRYDGDLHSVVATNVAGAWVRAAEADRALADGEIWGPLHGLPMTVKDVFEVAGMPATSGDPKLRDYVPENNATAVQRLVDAGAIVFGKTNVPYHALDVQTYNSIYGTTNNPWDLSRTPGGSSGGAAVALAAGFTSLELGSDIGGSVRIPAHYTGVFGHKPTFGLVPRYGHIPPMPGKVPPEVMPKIPMFVVGPMARSAEDLALALRVLTASDREEQSGKASALLPPRGNRLHDFRVAVWFTDSFAGAQIDDGIRVVLQQMVERLRDSVLDVDESARPNVDLYQMSFVHQQIMGHMLSGQPLPDWLAAEQKVIQAAWVPFFEKYDVLLAPVALTAAFPHDHKGSIVTRSLTVNGKQTSMMRNMVWARIAVVSGLPATVAPVGFTAAGLPVGVQIIGAWCEDLTTIAFARALSRLVGGFVPPPGYDP